ncbi:putative MFS-type transporter YddS [Microtetraspora sp. NBRC 13810]|uniref:MFS transporter n=1 Tax=Microtetraspora sp. NBRC 13810 TaxID=3030990 RepID=UPI0024A2A069|nr:MFS transporter [Microtetraspora sp. NBRC 13810]GLW05774.1 putative MFS-type transporter YddS [Microtetraspora sp. NBRC 13810]
MAGADRHGDRSQRGVLASLAAATAIGSTGLAAGGTAGVLLGADLAGTSAAAGLPVALAVAGSAGGALLIARHTVRGHRGRGLTLGYLLGALGAIVVIVAAAARSVPLLLIGSTVLGTANASVFMTRYAALEAGGEAARGRALGTVFAATAVGAVLSPTLLGPSGALAQAAGLPRLSGLYVVAVVAFGGAALVLAAASNPRVPLLGGGASVLARGGAARPVPGAMVLDALRGLRMRVAVLALALTNLVMVATMTVAPAHLHGHGQGLDVIGWLIAFHVVGMFGPSPLSGLLADRFGPIPVVLLGCSLLLAAGLTGFLVQEYGTAAMAVHLGVLGVGWNCGVVGGSALLAQASPGALRPHAEGVGEVTMGLAATVAAPVAGVIAATGDYGVYSLAGVAVAAGALLLLSFLGLKSTNRGRSSETPHL